MAALEHDSFRALGEFVLAVETLCKDEVALLCLRLDDFYQFDLAGHHGIVCVLVSAILEVELSLDSFVCAEECS
jgi:hypothetical protein